MKEAGQHNKAGKPSLLQGGRAFLILIALIGLTSAGAVMDAQVVTRARSLDDADMERPDLGPWVAYGTPEKLEKSSVARNGRRSLHVVTDDQDLVNGTSEGVLRYLGDYQPGDLLDVSFWFNAKAGQSIVAALGQTSFLAYANFVGTDWTRANLTLRCAQPGKYHLWISQVSGATEFYLDDFALNVVRRPQLGKSVNTELITLVGGPLRLSLCRKTGALAGIENSTTGEVYAPVGVRQPLLGLQVLTSDGTDFENIPFEQLRLRSVDAQPPKRAICTFTAAALPIEIAVTIDLHNDGSAELRGRIRNDSDRRVTACELPMLVGVRPAADPARLTLVHPDQCGQIETNASQGLGCQTVWPGAGVMGWMDLSGEKGGLYLATHDPSLTGTRLSGIPAPGGAFDLSLKHEIVVPPGQTQDAPVAVLAVHSGDWHASADRYRTWAQSWIPSPTLPRWIQQANGWVLIGLHNGISFHEIAGWYRQAQWMGVEFLHIQGEGIDAVGGPENEERPHYQSQMYVYPNPQLGSTEELKSAVRKIHAMDGHVLFYFLYDRWRPALSLGENMGSGRRGNIPRDLQPPPPNFYYQNALLESPGGALPTEHPFAAERTMCLASPGWRDWMVRWAKHYAAEYRADGFYWDVMGRNGPFRCFNTRHNHEGQNTWADGSRQVLTLSLKEGQKINSNYTCAIEGCSDALGGSVGFHLMSGATMTPNVFRYTFPSYLCVDGFSNHYWKLTQPQKARRVFLDGERFDLHGYHQEVRHIIDLRRRIKPFIDWPAVFKDVVGLRVSDPRVAARAFWRTDGKNKVIAVTMLNEQSVEGATVEVDLSPIGPPKTAHLFRLDGRVEKIAPGEGKQIIRVPADQVAAALLVTAVSPDLAAIPWMEQVAQPLEDGLTLSIFLPMGQVQGVKWNVNWPQGIKPLEKPLLADSDCLRRVAFRDLSHLNAVKHWEKVRATVKWSGGQAEAWTMFCPPLVNGDFEEVEDGWLAYWSARPCTESPGQGKYCIRLDRQSAPGKMLIAVTPLKPGCRYRFKALIRSTGLMGASAQIIEYEEGEKFVRSASLNSARRGAWEKVETTFRSHPNPRSSAIYLYNEDPDNPVWFDGLELEEIR
jgi:hypothetical protein